jgi:hypothetical protein
MNVIAAARIKRIAGSFRVAAAEDAGCARKATNMRADRTARLTGPRLVQADGQFYSPAGATMDDNQRT